MVTLNRVPYRSEHELKKTPMRALNVLYHNPDDEHDPYNGSGLTVEEVMWMRRAQAAAQGDIHSMKMMIEYSIGKPKFRSENINIEGDMDSLQNFLNECHEQDLKDAKANQVKTVPRDEPQIEQCDDAEFAPYIEDTKKRTPLDLVDID